MIPGVIAEQLLLVQQQAGENDTASLDFVAGAFSIGGTSLTAADVVSDPGRISGSGLSIVQSDPVNLLGAVRDLVLSANWTIVIEFESDTPVSGSHRLFLLTCVHDFLSDQIAIYSEALFGTFFDDAVASTSRFLQESTIGAVGINKIAVSRTSGRAAVSYNGEPVIADETNVTGIEINDVEIADSNGAAGTSFIRSIEVLPVQDDAALPGLSS